MLGNRYSTGSNLNVNSALIQNLYSQETTPLQAVHLAIDTGLEESGKGAGVKAYIRPVNFAILPYAPSHSTTALLSESPPNLKTACSYPFRSSSGFVMLKRADVSLISP